MKEIENINEEVVLYEENGRYVIEMGGIKINSWDALPDNLKAAVEYGNKLAESMYRLDETGFVSEEAEVAHAMYCKSGQRLN